MTDAVLIAQFLQGDVGAFNALVRRWERPIYNFLLRHTGSREDARDLCQKTFIRVYQGLRRLRDPGRFQTWVYQIALNVFRDAFRSDARHPLCSLEALEENRPDGLDGLPGMATEPSERPDAGAHGRDVRELLARALQAIPEEQRVVVVMKEYQGMRFCEIAEALEVPLNTVKSRMYYGLTALRKIFEAWHIDEEAVRYGV